MLRLPSLFAGLCVGAFAAPHWQDPQKPASPAPATTPAAVPGTPARHPLQGVYVLRTRVIDNKQDATKPCGYLTITQRHLFLCLAAAGPDADLPLVRAGVRSWKAGGDPGVATIELGFFTDKDGTLHPEKAGSTERRRIEAIQGGIRVMQDERSWLEFERIE